MDYNKLKTFVIVADYGSVSAASRQLRRSQSAISQQIQLLEDELELSLFERRNAKIFLSQDGERLYRVAKTKLGDIDDDIIALKKSIVIAEGHIRLGALLDGSVPFDLGRLVGTFREQYPKVSFHIVNGTEGELEQSLLDNRIDLALKIVFQRPELFVRRSVEAAAYSLYASPAYIKKHGPFNNFQQIVAADLLDVTDGFLGLSAFFRKNANHLLNKLSHNSPVVVANLLMLKTILLSGHGIAMLPDYLAATEVAAGALVKLMPKAKSTTGGMDIAYRTNHTLRHYERLFIDFVLTRMSIKYG